MSLDGSRLRREAPIPLYVQIRDRLVAAIEHGDLAPGDRIPSEPELVKTFRVGRPTVRQAVALLRQEGWVVTHRGLGTFAAGPSAEISLLSFDGLTQVLRVQGLSLRDTTLSAETAEHPDLEVLSVQDQGQWWIVRRLRHLTRGDHDEPLCVETDSFPLSVCPDAAEIFARTGSATAVLQEAYGYEIDACDVASRAVRVPQRWRTALQLSAGAPVLAVERVNHGPDGTVLHVGSFLIRTDLVPLIERLPNPAARHRTPVTGRAAMSASR